MVMRLPAVLMVGGSNPSPANLAPPPPPTVRQLGFEPPTKNFAPAALPFDRQWCESDMPPHCLEPSARNPPPPLKKMISSFRG